MERKKKERKKRIGEWQRFTIDVLVKNIRDAKKKNFYFTELFQMNRCVLYYM